MSQNSLTEERVSLREVTGDTVRQICKLSDTLSPAQQKMVAPNAVSIAEAYFSKEAWFRAVYAEDTPVGFVMLYIGPEDEDAGRNQTIYYLWRFMIAGSFQGKGYGRKALDLVIDHVRSLGAREMLVSCGEGEASPEGFYRSMGFERNGKIHGDEVELVKVLLGPEQT